jgi:hypothetical protein
MPLCFTQTSLDLTYNFTICFLEADCLGALLSNQNQSSIHVYDNPIPVNCDQSTNGGGWLIISRKVNNLFDFDRSNDEYAEGFGQIHSNFWLGSKKIAAIVKESAQLLIEIQNEHGQISYAMYRYFRMEVSNENETTGSIAGYTGNAGDVLLAEISSNVISLQYIKNLYKNTTLKTVEMKIRPIKGKFKNVLVFVYN